MGADDNYRKLADEMYDLRQQEIALETRKDAVRAEILKTGRAAITGDRAIVTVSDQVRKSYDMDRIRTLLTTAQWKACESSKAIQVVRAKLRRIDRARP